MGNEKYVVTHGKENFSSLRPGEEIKGNDLIETEMESSRTWYYINLKGNNRAVVISNFKTMLSVDVHGQYNDMNGLLGTSNLSGLIGRDGVKQYNKDTEYNLMGMDWQVRDNDNMLFREALGPQYPESCLLPSKEEMSRRQQRHLRSKTSALFDHQAKQACSNHSQDVFNMCYQDVLLSGDLDMAYAYAF